MEEVATCSSILAWEMPWTEEPGGLQCRVEKESATAEQLSTHTHWTLLACFFSFLCKLVNIRSEQKRVCGTLNLTKTCIIHNQAKSFVIQLLSCV